MNKLSAVRLPLKNPPLNSSILQNASIRKVNLLCPNISKILANIANMVTPGSSLKHFFDPI